MSDHFPREYMEACIVRQEKESQSPDKDEKQNLPEHAV
jgi:hypothetical protein